MDHRRWTRANELFQQAFSLPVPQRDHFLERACNSDTALRREVESLLATLDASEFLEPPIPGVAACSIPDVEPDILEGKRIGAYLVERRLASGGMGRVYLGSRADGQFEQLVAIKFPRQDVGADTFLSRFRLERRMLAALSHPNIAQLLDAGETDDGQPYFMMEYVHGIPIHDYCDRCRMTVRERLKLFRSVCAAVTHAHRHLVIHQDLKPDNILVGNDGIVKLLDFGIARLLDSDRSAPQSPSAVPYRMMTPTYASPEQRRGEPVTTASDVYSLGAVLHLLLTGHAPVWRESLKAMQSEGSIPETQIETPSVVANARAQPDDASVDFIEPVSASYSRGCTPEVLQKTLRGDLDKIVVCALHSDPARRFGSADKLSVDIGRYLHGLPVSVQVPTWSYRARKFAGRNKAAAMVSLVLALTLIVGGSVTSWQRSAARVERARTTQAREDTGLVTALLQSILLSASPHRQGAEVRVYDLLDYAASQLDGDLARNPEAAAKLKYAIGTAYLSLRISDRAVPFLREALTALRSVHDAPNLAVADCLGKLGYALAERSAPESVALLTEAMNTRAQLLGEASIAVAGTKSLLALATWRSGGSPNRFQRAETLLAEVFSTYQDAGVAYGVRLAAWKFAMGRLRAGQQRHLEAIGIYDEAIDIFKRVDNGFHQDYLSALRFKGVALESIGRFDEARAAYKAYRAKLRSLIGEEWTVFGDCRLARLEANLGNPGAAFAIYQASLLRQLETLQRRGPESQGLQQLIVDLAQSDFESAPLQLARLFAQAVTALRETGLGRSLKGVVMLDYAGTLFLDLQYGNAALVLLEAAVAIRHREAPDSPCPFLSYDLGRCLLAVGRPEEAIDYLQKSVEHGAEIWGADLPLIQDFERQLRKAIHAAAFAQGPRRPDTEVFTSGIATGSVW